MNAETALDLFNRLVITKTTEGLSQVENDIFIGTWKGQTQQEIASQYGWSLPHIKNSSSKLFRKVPEIFEIDVKVKKTNFKSIVETLLTEYVNSQESLITYPQIGNTETSNLLYIKPERLQDCYRYIVRPGALIRIEGQKQMGKTWLINNILGYGRQRGYKTVKLNIWEPEQAVIENLKSFLLWLCNKVRRELDISEQLSDIWEDNFGANTNCTIYFEDFILTKIEQPLVLGLDSVDRVFDNPDVATDFLGLLRSWREDAKVRDIWKKMRFIVAYSTEFFIPLNLNSSPFNVGELVKLTEFKSEHIGLLARGYDLNLEPHQIDKLMALVGGHPYLVKTALDNLKLNISLDELLLAAPTDAGIYSDYLTKINKYIKKNPELATALKKVVEAEEAVRLTDEEGFKLDSLGLVRKCGNNVTLRCDLYRQYFAYRLRSYSDY